MNDMEKTKKNNTKKILNLKKNKSPAISKNKIFIDIPKSDLKLNKKNSFKIK